MRHLFVTQDYAPDLGGMARRHVELCRRFVPDEVVVSTVGAATAADAEAFDRGEPYRIARQPFPFGQAKRFSNQVRWGLDLARRCRRGVDLLHLGNIRPCGYAVELASRRSSTPYLVYVNGGDLLKERLKAAESLLKRWTARDIFSRALGVVANSLWSAELARGVMRRVGVPRPPPVAHIDLGTDPSFFNPERDRGLLRRRLGLGDAPVALTVARLVPHKGQDVGIRAVASLAAEFPELRYLLVGDGPDHSRLAALARSLGVSDRIVFAGALLDEEVAEAYATSTLYLGLSRVESEIDAEGFGIAFAEASASGIPCIGGDSGGVRSAVRDGETGFVLPPTDLDAVTATMRRLLTDGELRCRMGGAGRLAATTHYNWDRVARETIGFAHDLLERRRDA